MNTRWGRRRSPKVPTPRPRHEGQPGDARHDRRGPVRFVLERGEQLFGRGAVHGVEARQRGGVRGKMRRHPVDDDADAGVVQPVDQRGEILGPAADHEGERPGLGAADPARNRGIQCAQPRGKRRLGIGAGVEHIDGAGTAMPFTRRSAAMAAALGMLLIEKSTGHRARGLRGDLHEEFEVPVLQEQLA